MSYDTNFKDNGTVRAPYFQNDKCFNIIFCVPQNE